MPFPSVAHQDLIDNGDASASSYAHTPSWTQAEDDLLVGFLYCHHATQMSGSVLPSGWTSFGSYWGNGNCANAQGYLRVPSSPAGSYTWDWSSAGGSALFNLSVVRITGVDWASFSIKSANQRAVSSSQGCPAVTTTVDDNLVLRCAGWDQDEVTTSMNIGTVVNGNGGVNSGIHYEEQASAGSTGTFTIAADGSDECRHQTFAIGPGASAGAGSRGRLRTRRSKAGLSYFYW